MVENKVEAAYRRGDLFAKRRQIMQELADYLKNRNADLRTDWRPLDLVAESNTSPRSNDY